ncbi:bifunctional biotin--[acetyl-CoA-carboxylase] ligase/biotin operon repressor BirA [Thalassotalea sp. HSM 43]|uniref:bifunctional biotin--[acetyl-CoA-carboxylase] ligase/biotin operon repressor BirA n=1 Tax=Thalassotalea sp. HSM 43 TaxID=2552945 RepID=UPI00107FF439|nr:bifunctional biotin--[acetyl-CoA-carboxylase] ligase/biotin operon repressor BirA [Thalassotalea sp. HSM 43]QBY04000.1 bifunctional biotin--[acetyl-CoA-carboxylase] ligase/biotin operon repressor BirA [Thalassotalea sp. HSM 43]
MAKVVREELIRQLASGQFVSGQFLAEHLGVSRAAISKHVKALGEMGLDIFSVQGKGYKLAHPMQLLEQEKISQHLQTLGAQNNVEVHTIIDSTNSYLMRRLPNQVTHGQVCISEYQSAGRGRRGKQWQSPLGSHLYMSMYWYLEQGMAAAMGISIVVGIAVADVLKGIYDLPVQLKWPNDIYVDGAKLAGILVELEGQSIGPGHCVIGLGLNVQMPDNSAAEIDQSWTDLSRELTENIDRNLLTAQLIAQISKRLQQHHQFGLAPMLDDWQKQDYFYNQNVLLLAGDKTTRGICKGINQSGALLLEVDGKLQPVYGGEVSLRAG